MAEKKSIWVILILVILLIIAFVYIGIAEISKARAKVYTDGAKVGYQEAIIEIANAAAACREVPLVVENQTMNLVWTQCLKAAPQSSSP